MRWKPSPEQISLAIDCATARVSFASAAALLGISPRTMRSFLRRLEKARAQAMRTDKEPGGGMCLRLEAPAAEKLAQGCSGGARA
jgi:hypothetical protein